MTHAEFQSAAETLVHDQITVTTTVDVTRYVGGRRAIEYTVYAHVGGECLMARATSADVALVVMREKLESQPTAASAAIESRLSLAGDVAKELAVA